ncbi:MAG: hypothetical protein NVV63_16910 [Opitutus sp.]|nr:hypothetical protein [Opitutus sp.]
MAALADRPVVVVAGISESKSAQATMPEQTATAEDINVWPTQEEEDAFLAESAGRGEAVRPVAAEVVEEVEDKSKPLPKLDEMVSQIPENVRDTLEELFRAKFVTVRRVPKKLLKTQP